MSHDADDRGYWIQTARRVAAPVLAAMAEGRLRKVLPSRRSPDGKGADRDEYMHLEALGRTLCGIAPWLELPSDGTDEARQREELAGLARRAIASAVDSASPDVANFSRGAQPLVDAAFLAHALLRAPGQLWERLPGDVQRQLVDGLESTRVIAPPMNNWLLFAAMVEAFLYRVGRPWNELRVRPAFEMMERWYLGDGTYGDGPHFHFDYYNSFVIHPMYLDALETFAAASAEWRELVPAVRGRAVRYAAVQERLIAGDGTFPPIGRSLSYRFGAFQLLSQMALRRELPEELRPAQVRCALTAVIRRCMEAPGTFDASGFLTVGLAGHQPRLGEGYISTGSPYLCCAGLLALGLPRADPFWSDPPMPFTQQLVWSGADVACDHAQD